MKRLFMLLLVAPWLCLASTARAADSIGLVIAVQGDAKAVAVGGSERALSLKSAVYLKDTLRTGAGSKLQIMFNDDSLFSQGENSEIVVDEYVYNPAKKDDNSFTMKTIKGISRIITGKITDLNPDRFTVKTGRATVGIRGCELGFEIEKDYDQIYVVRIPQGKRIFIGGITNVPAGLDITSPGWIRILNDGRILQGPLTAEDIQKLSGTTTAVGHQQPDNVTDEEILRNVEDLVIDVFPPPTPPPPPPVPPSVAARPRAPPIAGGGLGAAYKYVGPGSQLTDLFFYDRVVGSIGGGFSSVDLYGNMYDPKGTVMGPISLSLHDIPLNVFGGTSAYEGYRENALATGTVIANDNLQQFVRYIDYNNPTLRMAYWGNPATAFANSALPPGIVTTYAVDMAGYPEILPGPYAPPNDIKTGDLLVNTKTGNYCIRAPGGLTQFGRISDLTFFGQQSQGVGMNRNESAIAFGSDPEGREVAGFRVPGSDQPAESGGWSYHGYATGYRTPLTFAGPALGLMSANALSDNAGVNEGHVSITLNKDAYLNNVNLNISLFEDPAATTPIGITLGTPDFSAYVQGEEFVAAYGNPVNRIEVRNSGVGDNWTWGEWNGERTVDTGGGVMGNESVHGNFVAGRTLTAIEFQNLVNGVGYTLHTPSTALGVAFASITRGTYFSQISGTADLTVNISGGGGPATWGGNFSLAGGGDDLSFTVSPSATISAQGHLQGTVSSYILHAGGMTAGGLIQQQLTGNLVGPGTGPRPVTGAVGSGRFVHDDGTAVVLTYGTDLTP